LPRVAFGSKKKNRFLSCALWCGWVSSRSLPFCLKYGFLVAGEGRVGYTGVEVQVGLNSAVRVGFYSTWETVRWDQCCPGAGFCQGV